jgi:molybdate transport system substrate-binding protein
VVALLAACGGNSTATGAPSDAPGTAAPAAATPAPTRAASPAAGSVASPTHSLVPRPTTAAATPAIGGNLTIFAAASLTDAFNEMKSAIETVNPGTTITFNFAASSALRTQLEQGARADLFASADTVQMDNAKKANVLQGDSSLFVRNSPVIIAPANNPKAITGPSDLARPGVKLVLAAPEVPIGNYARQVIKKLATDPVNGADFEARTLANLVSNEANVRAVVAKIQLGEGDAGIVYASDLGLVRNQVQVIAIPTAQNVIAEYPIAIVKGTANAAGAQQFIAYLLSPAGQSILQKWGFIPALPNAAPAPFVIGATHPITLRRTAPESPLSGRAGGLRDQQTLRRDFSHDART